jgi:hypothetical protein
MGDKLMLSGKLSRGGQDASGIRCVVLYTRRKHGCEFRRCGGSRRRHSNLWPVYIKLYRAAPDETDKHFVGWLNGFHSGLNVAALGKGESTRNLGTANSTEQLLHSHCDAHPLQDVGQAAMMIYRSLPANTSAPKQGKISN